MANHATRQCPSPGRLPPTARQSPRRGRALLAPLMLVALAGRASVLVPGGTARWP